MSMNLTATTETGKTITLYQIGTKDTFYCLGWSWNETHKTYEGDKLEWEQIRDRYIETIKNHYKDYKCVSLHIEMINNQSFIDFDFI